MEFDGKAEVVKRVQRHVPGLTADGKDGPRTWAAIERVVCGTPAGTTGADIPEDTVGDITRVYGDPGDEGNLVYFTFPYPMWLYDHEQRITRHRCHAKCKEDLEGILEAARDELGMDLIREHDLDTYYGCFSFRTMRGTSQSISRHSWGIAIDLAAHRNGNLTPWPSKADMPKPFIDIFERYGWKSGARAWGRDAMHFQRTQ